MQNFEVSKTAAKAYIFVLLYRSHGSNREKQVMYSFPLNKRACLYTGFCSDSEL